MSQKKFLDKIGLQNFLNRIKALIPTKTSELQNDSGFITSEGTYDSSLSLESEKAVQNKVVTAAINGKQDTLSTAQTNAVDSGITSAKVQGYDSHISDTDIHVTQADKTSWDSKAPGTHTHLASEVSGLSTVATSGSYNDLSNKPSIPSKTSDLTNDSGFLTSHNPVDSTLSSTSTNAVQNKVINNALTGKSDTGHTHLASEVSGLSTVATSGSYFDLTNKPTIDSALSSTSTNAVQNKVINTELGKKANTTDLATVATSGSYADLSNKPSIPSKTSDLTNDSGFLTSHNPIDSSLSSTSTNAVQNKAVKAELDSKANSADLSTVASTGSYSDLNNIPSNFTPASHTHGSITNDGKLGTASRALITDGNKKIAVSSVTSTELGYLSGVTSAVQDQLDGKAASTHSHTASEVSGLATVATSGSYNDLTNKPTIPTVNNATLTIQKNGTTVKTFTANASSNVTANITVPTKVSELTNDSGFLTAHNPVDSALSDTSTNAVQNKIVKGALDGKSDTGHTHTKSEITDFPTLATVATSGSYNDLTNKPTIPTVNNATLTIQKNGTTVKTFTANASSNVTANITVPTKVSELTNDSGFLTSASSLDSSKLTGTIDIARLPKGALERLVTVADQTARFALTTSDVQLGDTVKQLDTGVMYIVTDESKLSSADGYTEYTAGAATSVPWSGVTGKPSSYTPASHSHGNIANGGTLGTASRALITDGNKKITTSSVTSTELGYVSGVTSAIQTQLNGKADSSHTHTASEVSGLSTVATSGSYNDLSNKPTIPTVNNATLTIQKNGSTVKTFTANASSNVTANITVPTKTSDLTNDSHQTITVGTDTTSTASPAHSGTFTCIDSVTRDSNGHVTAVNTKTVTLPADNNTDTLVTQNVSTANENHPILLTVTKDATNNQGAKTSIFASGVKVNPSTNTVTATTFSGALSGNASTATRFSANKSVTLTGDVTGTASSKAGWSVATTLSDSGVTAGTYGPSADVTGNNNATISVPEITVDSKGRVTSVANRTLTCKNNTYNVYNKTLTIQKNGTNVSTFTSNSNTDVTANITVPTKTSELTNDSGYLTSHQSLSNYVTLNSAQTITGDKNFEGQLKINAYSWIIRYKTQGTSNYTNYDTFKQIEYNKFNNIITLRRSADVLNSGDNFNVVDTTFAFYKIHVRNKYVDMVDNTRFINDGTNNAVYPITTNVTDLGTSTNKWANVYATTFTGNLTGNVTGNCSGSSGSCTGNAATATKFSATTTVALTGDATGTSAGSKKGWSVPVTLANSGVTAGTYGPSADVTGNNNATISVPEITVDAKGRVTSVVNRTLTCKNNTYTVNNATLTIQKNGTNVATFTSNASANTTANITVPTKVSELDNDSGFLTEHQDLSLYPFKMYSTDTGGLFKYINLADEDHIVTGFGGLTTTGIYRVRTTSEVPDTPTTTTVDGNLIVINSGSAAKISSYRRCKQIFIVNTRYGTVFHRIGSFASGTWTWYAWVQEVNTVLDQEIAGIKTFKSHLRFSSTNTRGTAPSAKEERDLIDYKDSAGNRIFLMGTSYYTDKSSSTSLLAYNTTVATGSNIGGITIGCDASGNAYTTAITPDASDDSTKIATTAWVNSKGYLTSHQSLSNYSTLANTVKSLSISGKTITVTPGSGSAYTLTTQDTVYTHPTTSGNKHIPSGGSSGQFLGWDSDGTAKWVNNPNTNTDTLMTQNVSTTNATYPVLLVATADATANQGAKTGIFAKSVKVNPRTNVISASGFSGPLTGNVTGNCSGTSANVTGTVAIANGGTGATSRLNAVKALTNENVGTGTNYFLTITSNWGKAGYCSVADAKTVLSVPTKTSQLTNDSGFLTSHQSLSNYVTLDTKQTISAVKTISAADLKFSTTATRGTAPSADISKEITTFDSAGNGISKIGAYYYTDKHSETRIYAYKTTAATGGNIGYLGIGCNTSGNVYTFAPTPATSDNSTQIATTAFVKAQGYLTSHQSLENYSTLANTVKSLSISGKTITVTPGSGSAYTLTTQDTVYTHPTTSGNKHIPSGGSADQYLKYSASGTAVWADLIPIFSDKVYEWDRTVRVSEMNQSSEWTAVTEGYKYTTSISVKKGALMRIYVYLTTTNSDLVKITCSNIFIMSSKNCVDNGKNSIKADTTTYGNILTQTATGSSRLNCLAVAYNSSITLTITYTANAHSGGANPSLSGTISIVQ